ncbi:hypothetical protein L7F22_043963 [Adiantum nelumboides]|nr:hypothetical protein [Adiantum nelumboides]
MSDENHKSPLEVENVHSSRQDQLYQLAIEDKAITAAYGPPTIASIIQNRYVTGVALWAVFGALCFGVDQGLMSVTLVMPQFTSQFPEIAANNTSAGFHKGLLTAMIELGAFVGAIFAPFVADHYSRRWSLRVGCMFFLIGSIIQTASFTYGTIVAGRLVGGLGIGMLSLTCPLYISELSPPNLRGILLSLDEFAIVFGICVAYYITFGTRYIASQASFRLPFALQMIPGILLLLGSILLPASPRWLAMKGRDQECLTTLAKLRQRDSSDLAVQAEWLSIRAEAQLNREEQAERHPNLQSGSLLDKAKLDMWSWFDTWGPGVWKRTLTGVLLMMMQQLVGINALIYYSPTLFENLGLSSNDRLIQAGVNNVCQLAGVMLSFFFIDRIGRRPLMVAGSFATFACMLIVGVLTAKFGDAWPTHKAEAKAAVAFLNLYMVSFGLALGPVPWLMPSELYSSSRLRSRGVAWSVMSNWLFNFIIGLVVPPFIQATNWGTFIFFACWCLICAFWSMFFLPETKGKTLEQLDAIFGDNSGRSDRDRRERISARLASEQLERQSEDEK